MRQPVFWLLAGPNGSGKSTFAESAIFENLAQTPEGEPLVRLNPDERARALRLRSPELSETELALRAAQESDDALDACLRAGRSVLVESVLSSEKFKSRVEAALAANMDFQLTFVVLRHPDLNVARVSQRVKLGGHGVEEGRIRARWLRSVENLPWFAARASAFVGLG
ncbi:MAG: AAA family ATPase [Alphaproteobacteria bacterium]